MDQIPQRAVILRDYFFLIIQNDIEQPAYKRLVNKQARQKIVKTAQPAPQLKHAVDRMFRTDHILARLLQLSCAADMRRNLRGINTVRIRPLIPVQVGAGRVFERVFHNVPIHAGKFAFNSPLVDIQIVRQKPELAFPRPENLTH